MKLLKKLKNNTRILRGIIEYIGIYAETYIFYLNVYIFITAYIVLEKAQSEIATQDITWSTFQTIEYSRSIYLVFIAISSIIVTYKIFKNPSITQIFPCACYFIIGVANMQNIFTVKKLIFYYIIFSIVKYLTTRTCVIHGEKMQTLNAIEMQEKTKEEQEFLRICTVHEAGHAVMAVHLKVKNLCVIADQAKGYIQYHEKKFLKSKDIKKNIMITFSGAVAEEILLGEVSSGSLGAENSDIFRAVKQIRMYIILKENAISTCGIGTGMEEKIAEMSSELYREVQDILSDQKEMIERVAKALESKGKLTELEIKEIIRLPDMEAEAIKIPLIKRMKGKRFMAIAKE